LKKKINSVSKNLEFAKKDWSEQIQVNKTKKESITETTVKKNDFKGSTFGTKPTAKQIKDRNNSTMSSFKEDNRSRSAFKRSASSLNNSTFSGLKRTTFQSSSNNNDDIVISKKAFINSTKVKNRDSNEISNLSSTVINNRRTTNNSDYDVSFRAKAQHVNER
jgi:hypothetical protein